jgi:DNA (cytosine-5)-methyltransferase 1
MNYLSVCSGVEAATVAWHKLGWNPVAFSEIEKFPSEVLAHHYPGVPNLGDMSNYKEWNFGKKTIDLLVGGTPCQSFSVAGLRKGLEDPRGNLALIYVGILNKFKPKWFIWENVPGVLSSNKGRDFGSFLGAVGKLGYGFSYRVLDAQNFGVPQRRRRVFVVGHFGDWRPAAEVLFEPESLSRHIEESRKKRKDTPKDTRIGIDTSGPLAARDYKDMGTDGLNRTSAKMIPTTAHCLQTTSNDYSRADGFNMIPEQTDALLARDYKGLNSDSLDKKAIVEVFENHPADSRVKQMGDTCHSVTARWGTGGGNIPFVLGGQHPNAAVSKNKSPTLTNAMGSGGGHVPVLNNPIAYSIREDGQKNNMSVTKLDVSNCLSSHQPSIMSHHAQTFVMDQAVAFGWQNSDSQSMSVDTITPTLDKSKTPAVAFDTYNTTVSNTNQTIKSPNGGVQESVGTVFKNMAVRKLTPIECERLQGFPDGYTNIKENCPDGHRYKAMGNSMAVPVMKWIGKRIELVSKTS